MFSFINGSSADDMIGCAYCLSLFIVYIICLVLFISRAVYYYLDKIGVSIVFYCLLLYDSIFV